MFNNWSPYLVESIDTFWVGLEYFCTKGDELWNEKDRGNEKDRDLIQVAASELEQIGSVDREDVVDGVVTRVPKMYEQIDPIR